MENIKCILLIFFHYFIFLQSINDYIIFFSWESITYSVKYVDIVIANEWIYISCEFMYRDVGYIISSSIIY